MRRSPGAFKGFRRVWLEIMSRRARSRRDRYTSLLAYVGLAVATSSLPLVAAGAVGMLCFLRLGDPAELRPASVMLGYGSTLLVLGLFLAGLEREPIKTGDAVVATALIWVTVPVLAAVPFMLAAGIPFVDALFEAVSGWTTTGLTILSGEPSSWGGVYVPRVEELPATLRVWRTAMQWVGGLGIVVFTVAFLARPGISAAVLYIAEGKLERLEASLKRSAFKMGLLY
ncbi:MAG: potassium transporter TrkG, partial [Candidatus Korarchaeota archaeon]|nr:potassium transporter TrkG [Candidatus Korarchaeota archaeon]